MREILFWFVDSLKGGSIRHHYNEIKFNLEHYHSSKSVATRKKHLHDLLDHSVSTTPFYKKVHKTASLEDFPVIDKSIIRNNFEDFRSESFRNKKTHTVSSSGSTGTPFKVYQNTNKRHRHYADTIYFAERSGYKFGSKLVYMRVWTPLNRKGALLAWMQNINMQDISNPKDDTLAKLLATLTSPYEKGVVSYASALETLCKYLDRIEWDPLPCNLNSIIAISERLDEYTKAALQIYFNTTVVSRYSNAENGILSQQNIDGTSGFDINWASYYIEILKLDEDTPVESGEYGRVVVTDLFNYGMPMIRYDTGDIACFKNSKDNIPSFEKVEGRKLDVIYNTKGEILSSYVIGSLMAKYTDLKQFQFIQESKTDYVFRLNTINEFQSESQLIREFKECLGEKSHIQVEYLEEIPLLASGKRRQVVNNYINS